MKKKLLLVFYIIIISVLLASNVYATVTTDLVLTTDKTAVKAGEDVIVSISLKNISSKIASVKGFIDIDENVLNGISEDMIVKNSEGKIEVISGDTVTNTLSYSYAPTEPVDTDVIFNTSASATESHDLYFTEDFKTGISSDSVVLKLKLTVKSGVSDGDMEKAVKVVDLIAESTTLADGTATTDTSAKMSADVTIKVDNVDHEAEARKQAEEEAKRKAEEEAAAKKKAEEEAAAKKKAEEEAAKKAAEEAKKNNTNKNTNNTNTNTNRNTNNTNKNTNNTNTNSDNTVSGSRIPATGARSFIIPFSVLCLLGFISYKKYMNYKEF